MFGKGPDRVKSMERDPLGKKLRRDPLGLEVVVVVWLFPVSSD